MTETIMTIFFNDGKFLVKSVPETMSYISSFDGVTNITCLDGESITLNLKVVKYILFKTSEREV